MNALDRRTYQIFDLATRTFTLTTEEYALEDTGSNVWSPDLEKFALSTKRWGEGVVKVYDTASGDCTAEIPLIHKIEADLDHLLHILLVWAPDSTRLVVNYARLGVPRPKPTRGSEAGPFPPLTEV